MSVQFERKVLVNLRATDTVLWGKTCVKLTILLVQLSICTNYRAIATVLVPKTHLCLPNYRFVRI